MAKEPWLRYQDDRRTLGFCALYFASLAVAWWYPWEAASWTTVGVTFAWFVLSAFQGCVTVHNCAHTPPFVRPELNAYWFLVISAWNGASATAYIPGHNLGHHKYLQTRSDVIRTSKVNHRYQLFNLLTFFPRVIPAIIKNDNAYFAAQRKLGRQIVRQFHRDTATVLTFYACLGILGPVRFLWLVLLPQLLAKDMIVTLNLLQHDGCDPQHRVNHSRNFTGPILNYFCFNNGYHGIHHMMPGKHWSLLPALHKARVAPHNHPSLNHPNILSYILWTYVVPSRRINYDGTPYTNPGLGGEAGDDVPWHYATTSLNATTADPNAQKELDGYGDDNVGPFGKNASVHAKAG